MLALQRQREILKLVEQAGAARVAALAGKFGVTEETIRRDLTMLESDGRVTRSHGGAVPAQSERHEVAHHRREIINKEEKNLIAEEALTRIEPGDTILMDASSSSLFLARLLPDRPLTVVTNSLLAVQALADHEAPRILCVGGSFNPLTMSFAGPLAEKCLKEYHVNKCFFSCRGVDIERGLTDPSEASARIKQQMLSIADQRILLADHSKFSVRALAVFAGLSAVTEIITDAGIEPGCCEAIRQFGVKVSVARSVELSATA